MLYQAADLHLTPTVWKNMPSMQGDSYAALDQIVDICTGGGVVAPKGTALLISGDIFDKPKPDSESVGRFVTAMEKLKQCRVDVYIIQGQHEKADPPWGVALGAVTYVGDGKVFTIDVGNGKTYDAVSVVGFDYTNALDLKAKLKGTKKVDILMLHQMAKQAIDIEGQWDFDIDWVAKSVKLVLAGDYHAQLNIGRLWYPGATHLRNISETGAKYIIRVNTKNGMKPELIQLQARQIIEVRVATDDQLDEAVKTITDVDVDHTTPIEIAMPLVIARYSTEVKSVVARIEEACQSREFLLRLKPLVSDTEDVETEMPQADATLASCLDQIVEREKDPELHSFVSSLLATPETRNVLAETKQQLGIGE